MFMSLQEIEEQLFRGAVTLHRGDFVPMADAALWLSLYPGKKLLSEVNDGCDGLRQELGEHPDPSWFVVERWDDGEDEEGNRLEGMTEFVSLAFVREVAVRRRSFRLALIIDRYLADRAAVLGDPQTASDAADVVSPELAGDGQPLWTLSKPKRTNGYTGHLYRFLAEKRRAGVARPTPKDVLRAWTKAPPAGLEDLSPKGFSYQTKTKMQFVDVQALGDAIDRMTGRKASKSRAP